METIPFENVKNQIGFCGIWCGSCMAGDGAMQELARRFETIAKNCELEKWVPKEFDFKEFIKDWPAHKRCLCVQDAKKAADPRYVKLESVL